MRSCLCIGLAQQRRSAADTPHSTVEIVNRVAFVTDFHFFPKFLLVVLMHLSTEAVALRHLITIMVLPTQISRNVFGYAFSIN